MEFRFQLFQFTGINVGKPSCCGKTGSILHLRLVHGTLHPVVHIKLHHRAERFPFGVSPQGSHQHHPVRCTRAVNSRCRSILQYLDRRNIRGIQIVNIAYRNTVHNIQRIIRIIYRADPAHAHCRPRTGRTAYRRNRHTGGTPLQSRFNPLHRRILEIICIHLGYRPRKVALPLNTVPYNHNLIQILRIFLQNNTHILSRTHMLRKKTDIRNGKGNIPAWNSQTEMPVHVRSRPDRLPLNGNIHP
ncbi:hypothetical protein Barb6_03601 [Bacteroidales bacterium Barb6]|nr:hypothetical protein Barb6_03601 [Bacteroidales bacterium Barb6]